MVSRRANTAPYSFVSSLLHFVSSPLSIMANGELPSGMPLEEAWDHLQDKLWIIKCKDANKAKTARAKATPVVDDDDPFAPVRKEGAAPVEQEGAGPEEGPTGVGFSPSTEGGSSPTLATEKTPSPETEENPPRGAGNAPSPPADKGSSPGMEEAPSPPTEGGPSPLTGTQGAGPAIKEEPLGGPMAGEAGDPEDDENPESDDDSHCYLPRLDGWMHPDTLTFARFGHPSASEDVDLKMKWTSGPSDRKGKFESGDPDDDGQALPGSARDEKAGLQARDINAIPGAGDAYSRPKTKGALAKERSQTSSHELKSKLVNHLMNPSELKLAEHLVESVKTLADYIIKKDRPDEEAAADKRRLDEEAAANAREAAENAREVKGRERWQHNINELQMKIQLLQSTGQGETAMARALQVKLMDAVDAPIVVPNPITTFRIPADNPATPPDAFGRLLLARLVSRVRRLNTGRFVSQFISVVLHVRALVPLPLLFFSVEVTCSYLGVIV